MLSEIAIRARGVTKAYNIFARPEDRLKQILWRGRRNFFEQYWALRGIDLDVHRGETVGIVGRNGSGKSTFLQVLCGILTPTAGEMSVRGRIAALLELGAGFNPEFTGRENIYMSAAIIGLEQKEIERRFDAIAAFADVGVFLNQPVKTYSSGMYARVAFATAINVDPDILVVDEALSVGDEAFQRKCFGRIHQIRESGATVLFVSHSAGAIIELCERAVLFDQGEVLAAGAPKAIISSYQKLVYAPQDKVQEVRNQIRASSDDSATDDGGYRANSLPGEFVATAPIQPGDAARFDPNLIPQSTVEYGTHGARIADVHLRDGRGRKVNVLVPGHKYQYCYTVSFQKPAFKVRFGMMIKTVSGYELSGMVSHASGSGVDHIEAGRAFEVCFSFRARFAPLTYFMNAGVVAWVDGEEQFLHRIMDALMFRVSPRPADRVTGLVDSSDNQECVVKAVN